MSSVPTLRELEGKRTLSILLFLSKNERVKKSDLYKKVSQTGTMASKLDYLELNGLITLDQRKFENNTTYVELTQLGVLVAKQLQSIEDLMGGLLPEEPPTNCSSPSSAQNMVR